MGITALMAIAYIPKDDQWGPEKLSLQIIHSVALGLELLTHPTNNNESILVICVNMVCANTYLNAVCMFYFIHLQKFLISHLCCFPFMHTQKKMPSECTNCLTDSEFFLKHPKNMRPRTNDHRRFHVDNRGSSFSKNFENYMLLSFLPWESWQDKLGDNSMTANRKH
jgi:hypothetical protein